LLCSKKISKKKSKKKKDPLGEVNNGIVVFDSYILGQLSIIFVSVLLVSPLLSPLLDFLLSIKLRNEREGGNSLVCRHSFNSILILFLRIFRKYICFNKDESKRWVGRGVVIWWVGFGIEGGKCTHHACRPSYEHVVENGKFFLSLIAYIYIYIYPNKFLYSLFYFFNIPKFFHFLVHMCLRFFFQDFFFSSKIFCLGRVGVLRKIGEIKYRSFEINK
jgi:hypothetical protein